MTPKEKTEELLKKFDLPSEKPFFMMSKNHSKQCALIAVNEIIDLEFNINCDASERCVNPVITFYEKVKQEIEKL